MENMKCWELLSRSSSAGRRCTQRLYETHLGSEEAREVALTLASVRLSNCTYGFPVCSFHEDA